MRMIFSTVLGPQEPALTVGSFAISATGRPPTWAIPVTTPSAPKPTCSQLARRASSTKVPGSTSLATRSRTGSLPWSFDLAWWRSGPPPRARSRASLRSDMARGNVSAGGAQLGAQPAPDHHVAQAHHAHAGSGAEHGEAERGEHGAAHREQADPGACLGADDPGDDLAPRSSTWVWPLHLGSFYPVPGHPLLWAAACRDGWAAAAGRMSGA